LREAKHVNPAFAGWRNKNRDRVSTNAHFDTEEPYQS
jgi:hypothetical protein